jgi:hypothetical protein
MSISSNIDLSRIKLNVNYMCIQEKDQVRQKKKKIHIDLRINNLKLRKKHIEEEEEKKAAIVSYVINEKY